MAKLDKQRLKKLIKLEMKTLIDEDALFLQRNIPGDYDEDVINFRTANSIDLSDPHTHDDEECNICAAKKHRSGCACPACSDKLAGIYESCGCGGSSSPHEEEYRLNYNSDAGIINHKQSSYMARPQLAKIAKYASHLFDIVDENEQLEDWQESKIAQISQMIGDVYHSIEYDEEYESNDLGINDIIGMVRTENIS